MGPILLRALKQIKAEMIAPLRAAAIERLCTELGYAWRERILTPVVTLQAFLQQVLHGNTACTHVPHLMNQAFTAGAYCQARQRLPLALFERLLSAVIESLSSCREEAQRWCGHRVWLLDGSSCSMPDTEPLQQAFGQPGGQRPGCGFPVAHLLVLFHAGTGMLQKLIATPLRTHDMACAWQMHAELAAGDVIVADRALCSYAHLAMLLQRGLHGVFRLHQCTIVSFRIGRLHLPLRAHWKDAKGLPRSRWVRWLGHLDQVVEYYKPSKCPEWLDRARYALLPPSIGVRELRFTIEVPGFRTRTVTLVTTLLDPQRYPLEELAQLYLDRWRVELNRRHLKQTLHLDVLRCQSVDGVRKEMLMIALVYNLVRLVMLEAARQQQVHSERISFIDALRWLNHARPGQPLRRLIVHPLRQRVEPRVRKRRAKEYPLMRRPRDELRNLLLAQ